MAHYSIPQKEKFMSVLSKLRFVTWCHLPPISIQTPHIPFNIEEFPAAGHAFSGHSLVSSINLFGTGYGLLDISGLDHAGIGANIASDQRVRSHRVEMVRFLQCLEWIHEGNYNEKFSFTQIVAYLKDGMCVVAKPTETGFDQVPYPNYRVPWNEGTLMLCVPDEI
jgi:hypothetical protein